MTYSNIEKFGEVFTPDKIINDLLYEIDYSDSSLKICEPSFGDGRILLEIKRRLLKYHSERHILENMLYGIEIQQKWYDFAIEQLNPNNYKHNFHCCSALNFDGFFNPLNEWRSIMDYVIANPPYNRNILKKSDVSEIFWNPSGYTTKLAYCCFVVMGTHILKSDGKLSYVMPCSFTHNENTEYFRDYMRKNLNIDSIKILSPNAFDGIMIRTCIFKATKGHQSTDIYLEREWNGNVYKSTTFYNQYGEIPLFIGDTSKEIYELVMQNSHTLNSYKGWNGVDSYAKVSSKDPLKYKYQYVDGVSKKGEVILCSSECSDKVKAKPNKKKNNVGNYDRFHTKKILINEVLYGSLETRNHLKYIITDKNGNYGSSPKHTVIVFEDEDIDAYIQDLCSPIAQMMMTIMKDYNHNDSKIFQYLPYGISNTSLNEEQKTFLENFDSLSSNNIINL